MPGFGTIFFRLLLRVKMGKRKRDEYLKNTGIFPIDFLPETLCDTGR